MPYFKVYSVDAWGNAVDGYETNDVRSIGAMISDNSPEGYIKGLIHAGLADAVILQRFRDEEVQVDVAGGDVVITANSPEDAVVDEQGEVIRFYEGDELEEGQAVGEVIGQKPELLLEPIPGRNGTERFFATRLDNKDMLELRILPGKEASTPGQFDVDLYLAEDFFGTYKFPKEFEDGSELAVTTTGEMIFGDTDDSGWALIVSKARVALDAFIERGGQALPALIEGEADVVRLAQAIRDNSTAVMENRITHRTFSQRNRALWDEALQLRIQERVTDWLRDNADGWYGNEGDALERPKYDAALFESDPDLPRLVRQDGFRDGATHWDLDLSDHDVLEIRRDPVEWARAHVLEEVGGDYFGGIEQMREDADHDHPGLSEAAWKVLLDVYRSAVIAGVAEQAEDLAQAQRDDR